MLGGSLDCNCTIKAQCTLEDCECDKFCKTYFEIYEKIIAGQYVYLTYSPKIDRARIELLPDYEATIVNDFYMMLINSKSLKEFIMVVELTQKGQIHFHAMIRVKDKVKFTKEIIQKLYWSGNILPLWNKQPKASIHYLFKSSDFMADYFGATAIFTRDILPKPSIYNN